MKNTFTTRLVAFVVFIAGLIGANGCDSPEIPSDTQSSFTQSESPADEPTEWFFLVADGLPLEVRAELKERIGHAILTSTAGTLIHVVRTPDHKVIASIAIPDGEGNKRLRDRDLAYSLAQVGRLLDDNGDVPPAYREQLALGQLASSYWSLRTTDFPCRVFLFGTANHYSLPEKQWNFADDPLTPPTRFPSISSLTHPDSTLPFNRVGRKAIPGTTEIVWLVAPNWAGNKSREEVLVRFYRHAFSLQIGGTLAKVTSDFEALFEENLTNGFSKLEELVDPLPPRMIEFPPSDAISSQLQVPSAVSQQFKAALEDPQQSLIAINWSSNDPEADLDLWIGGSQFGDELNYKNMETPFGKLIRDVKHPGEFEQNEILGKWEVAILKGVDPHQLDWWLNTYTSNGSKIHTKLVTIINGRQVVKEFDLDSTGDEAKGKMTRKRSPAWLNLHQRDNS